MASSLYKIVIIIEDQPDGSVRVVATPNVATMMEATRRGLAAKSSAVAYAMAALTKIAADSRKQRALIVLPPGIRS